MVRRRVRQVRKGSEIVVGVGPHTVVGPERRRGSRVGPVGLRIGNPVGCVGILPFLLFEESFEERNGEEFA